MKLVLRGNPIARFVTALTRLWAYFFGFDLFISYARADGRRCVDAMRKRLEDRYLIFIDEREMEGGDRIDRRIHRELERCRMLVVMTTPEALRSRWVCGELTHYLRHHGKRARVLPVFVPRVTPESIAEANCLAPIRDYHGYYHPCPPEGPCSDVFVDTPGALIDRDIVGVLRSSYTGPRRRRQAIATLAGVAAAVVLGFAGLVYEGVRAERRHELVSRAAAAMAEQRMLSAELTLADAADRYGSSVELRERYLEARAGRLLTPLARVRLPSGWSLESLTMVGGQPVFLLARWSEDPDAERLAIATATDWIHEVRCGDLDPQIAWRDGWAFLHACGTLTRVDISGAGRPVVTASTGLQTGAFKDGLPPTALSWDGDTLLVLGRLEPSPLLLRVDPGNLEVVSRIELPVDPAADSLLAFASADRSQLVIAQRASGARDIAVAFAGPTGMIVEEARSFPLPVDELGFVIPKLWSLALAPDDRQLFVEIYSVRLGGVSDRPGVEHWVALDLDAPRAPLLLEPGISRLEPRPTHSPIEALYSTEGGDLRGLGFIALVVLSRPAETLLGGVERWHALPAQDAESIGAIAVAARDGELLLCSRNGARAIVAAAPAGSEEPPEAVRLALDSTASVVAIQYGFEDHELLSVWRIGAPSPVDEVPPVDELRRVLSSPDVVALPESR